jgi:integrase
VAVFITFAMAGTCPVRGWTVLYKSAENAIFQPYLAFLARIVDTLRMSLFKRGGIWWSRIVVNKEATVQSLKTRNKDEARAFEAVWRADRLRGEHGLAKSPTFEDFAPRFIDYLPGRVRRSSMTAYIGRMTSLLSYKPLAECPLDKIDAAVIEGYRMYLQKATKDTPAVRVSTINARLRTLRRALKLAVEWNVLRRAPKIAMLGGEHQREFILSEAVLQQFLDRAPTDVHRALWLVLADTGIRIGEACALVWDDVEGSPPVAIHIRKGKTKFARRRVPLTKRASAVLDGLHRDTYVFSRGRSINQPWANKPFVRIRGELGLPPDCVLHSLRHTALTRWGNAGVSPFILQKLAGHSSIVLTARYSHPDDDQMDAAIALLD